jgi:hypothetical protein
VPGWAAEKGSLLEPESAMSHAFLPTIRAVIADLTGALVDFSSRA